MYELERVRRKSLSGYKLERVMRKSQSVCELKEGQEEVSVCKN